jgi:hypothetical protein
MNTHAKEQPAARLEVGRHGGLLSWSRRSGPHVVLPADRNPFPLSACQPSARAAATASPPVRAGLHAPLPVKAAERSGAPAGPGLDREWYTWCARAGGSFFLEVLIQDMSSTCIVLICASNFR